MHLNPSYPFVILSLQRYNIFLLYASPIAFFVPRNGIFCVPTRFAALSAFVFYCLRAIYFWVQARPQCPRRRGRQAPHAKQKGRPIGHPSVEKRRLERPTPTSRTWCATNCATSRRLLTLLSNHFSFQTICLCFRLRSSGTSSESSPCAT